MYEISYYDTFLIDNLHRVDIFTGYILEEGTRMDILREDRKSPHKIRMVSEYYRRHLEFLYGLYHRGEIRVIPVLDMSTDGFILKIWVVTFLF
jgi:hypothetical protein